MKRAIYPGSFYPFTIGHLDILQQAQKIFDEVVVFFANNSNKHNNNPELNKLIEEQKDRLVTVYGVRVVEGDKMTIDVAKEFDCDYIIRGLRNSQDFEYEKNIANINKIISPRLTTVFLLPTKPIYENISSSFVREMMKYNKDIKQYIL